MRDGYVIGRYRLQYQLGRGGMGSVWQALHVDLGTPAAVKFIDPDIAAHPEALARFKREAQSAASLRGSNVVQILDYGVESGTPFIVMEKLEGEDLGSRLARRYRLEPAEVANILSHAGKALQRAHKAGIVHRDLKPDNIYLAQDGDEEVVKVLDFGIAKTKMAFDVTGAPTTQTGAMLGTPFYMSPEQASGKREVDHRTDIWALTVIAFECLTGRRPFEADTIGGLVLAICAEPIPVPSRVANVPPGFDAWFARGTSRDPRGRFQSVKRQMEALRELCGAEVARRGSYADISGEFPLERLLGDEASSGRPAASAPRPSDHLAREPIEDDTASPMTTRRMGPRASRLPWLAVSAVVIGLALAGLVGVFLLIGGGARTTTAAAPSVSADASAATASSTGGPNVELAGAVSAPPAAADPPELEEPDVTPLSALPMAPEPVVEERPRWLPAPVASPPVTAATRPPAAPLPPTSTVVPERVELEAPPPFPVAGEEERLAF